MICIQINISARSPMFSHINSTIIGLTTIKAHNGQQKSYDEYDELQDFNISSGFIFFALSRALSLWIDIVCVLYMMMVLMIFFIYENGKYTKYQHYNIGVPSHTQSHFIDFHLGKMSLHRNILLQFEHLYHFN